MRSTVPLAQSSVFLALAFLAAAALSIAACDKHSAADDHLRTAGQEAKAAVTDVGKAIDSTVPVVKDAGRSVGDDIRQAGQEAGPRVRAAGHDLKDAADTAGDDLKNAGHRLKADTKKDSADRDASNRDAD